MRALAVVLAVVLASCILAVSPDTYGPHCRFAGEDTQCGACVKASCQPEVDAACGDPSVVATETCAARHDATCDAIPAGPLATCLKNRCAGVCRALAGQSTTSCKEPPLGAGSACTCSLSAAPNDAICDPVAYPGTICCAPMGWPAQGLACSCRPLGCNATSDGCFCSLAETTPAQEECGGAACCAERDACTCRAKGCYPFETPVPSCAIAAVGCAEGQIRVDSCSIR